MGDPGVRPEDGVERYADWLQVGRSRRSHGGRSEPNQPLTEPSSS
ncbi:protein of unknown function [Micropruina glycogenica]|uniref:Uncharacterized protein n=1 Tax=Micropruina glycogenica TaxID=75385 RepID=A0A2N9JGQ4_9ACTN|nr:protein of unknown function [Micropruina glycogenica]